LLDELDAFRSTFVKISAFCELTKLSPERKITNKIKKG